METQNLLYNSCSEIPLCGLCLLSTGILFKQYFTVPTQTPSQQFSYETRVHEGTSPWIWIRSHKALGVGEVTEQSHIAFSLNFFYICCEVKYFLLPTSISSLKEKMLISAILPRLSRQYLGSEKYTKGQGWGKKSSSDSFLAVFTGQTPCGAPNTL